VAGVKFITRQAADTPFVTYVGLSHWRPPEAVHPVFDQTSPARLGQYVDLIAEMDFRVRQIVDCIDQAGITQNTLVVYTSDAAAGDIPAFQGGSNGPFRGSFRTPLW
jgi:arylsulfatase A-like enzyme